MNNQIQKIIDAANKSPKTEITFKIGGVDKSTLKTWTNDLAKEGLKATVITLASGDTGLQLTKISAEEMSLVFEEVENKSFGLKKLSNSPDSSAIEKISWEGDGSGTLFVKFTSGSKTYQFDAVPEQIYHDFVNAPSQGRYFQKNIQKKYSEAK